MGLVKNLPSRKFSFTPGEPEIIQLPSPLISSVARTHSCSLPSRQGLTALGRFPKDLLVPTLAAGGWE